MLGVKAHYLKMKTFMLYFLILLVKFNESAQTTKVHHAKREYEIENLFFYLNRVLDRIKDSGYDLKTQLQSSLTLIMLKGQFTIAKERPISIDLAAELRDERTNATIDVKNSLDLLNTILVNSKYCNS